ncbi:MAG: exoX [Candidatus Eremiobacteraeota bacterium]|nr:exoX [Candidatus Eremiobacteraeota bacterium]
MTIDEAPFVYCDTETTGLGDDAQLLEIAAHAIQGERRFATLVRPTIPIPADASALHHIVDADVADAPSREEALYALQTWLLPDDVIVCHNVDFDQRFLPEIADRKWLCSLRLARHLLPDLTSHKNAALWYHFGGEKIEDRLHGAVADIAVTRFVFENLLRLYRNFAREHALGDPARIAKAEQIDTLIAFSARPYILKFMPFGKHRGVSMDAVPVSYFRWALEGGMPDLDADLRFNFERQLKRRAA